MNIIQKFFYNLTKEYTENKEKKEKNWKELWEYIEAKETQLRSEQWDNATECDGKCPRCDSKKDIVDKIQRVNGVYRSIDTTSVNHCNSCGHQWLKYKRRSIDSEEVIRHINNKLCGSMEWEHCKYIQKELQPFYAENLRRLFIGWTSRYSAIPTMDWLKKNFKSVYDK